MVGFQISVRLNLPGASLSVEEKREVIRSNAPRPSHDKLHELRGLEAAAADFNRHGTLTIV